MLKLFLVNVHDVGVVASLEHHPGQRSADATRTTGDDDVLVQCWSLGCHVDVVPC